MKVLALDTATEACSAALYVDGEYAERMEIAPREHANLVLGMVDALLAEADLSLRDLDALAFSRGPGAFTGVRIGVGVAQGLGFGADLPLVPVSTLAALAHGAWRIHGEPSILAALDARMGEVYWAACSVAGEGQVAVPCEQVSLPERVSAAGSGWFGAGSGWASYHDQLVASVGAALSGTDGNLFPRARDVAALGVMMFREGMQVSPAQAQPVYLRDQVARKSSA